MKNLEFDKQTGKFVRRKEIEIGNARAVDEIRQSLKIELAGIVRQVKGLKRRADEIKEMLKTLDDEVSKEIPDHSAQQ